MFIDSHCHIYSEYYDDIENVVLSAKEVGVIKLLNNAADLVSCNEVIKLSDMYDGMYFSLGIHPESVFDSFDELEKLVIDNLDNPKFVAIGEIGLDYHYGKDTKEEQIELFEKQLKLAETYNLPVIIHSREATQDTLNCIKKYNVKGVLHCFNGSLEIAKEYIKLGFYFGVNGVVTFKNANIKEVIKDIPLERILLETDSPYLTPEPFRKYKNEPKYIPTIADFLANLYNVSLEEVSSITNSNIFNLFDF